MIDQEHMLKSARKILSGHAADLSPEDLRELANVALDYKAMADNLGAVQTRCTELLEETRRLRQSR